MMKFLSFIFLILFFTAPVNAYENKLPLNDWAALPILHDGRIKPLDSFSSTLLEQISGKSKINGMDNNQWLAKSIFMPEEAILLEIFKIKNAENFNLEKRKLYNFTTVSQIINDNQETIDKLSLLSDDDLSIEQKNLLDLHMNYGVYNQLLRSMTAIIPLKIKDRKNPISYFDLTLENQNLPNKYLETKIIRAAGSNNIYFKIIPQKNLAQTYATIWQALLTESQLNNDSKEYISLWQNLANSYRENNETLWVKTVQSLYDINQTPITKLEKIYNDLSLVFVAFLLFFTGLACVATNEFRARIALMRASTLALTLGSIAITADVILRTIISHRPPVGTLYESILFVCVITAIGSTYFAIKKSDKVSLFIGSISGTILLLTANAFVGLDSFSPLVAVLNTDFWLSTHVIIITAGYAFCILTALYAHIIMWRQDYNKKSAPYKNLNVLMILSLLFVTVGTVLGGLWADQSWGRFWGWDPKENGAMLIVLWIIWLLHGKITHDLPIKFYMAGVCFLSIIVALAWFGVNLLSVGLHSYGFISGIATGLGLFCAAEMLIILYLTFIHRRANNES